MAVGDSTGGFNFYENNSGEQVASAQQSIAGAVGERKDVQFAQAGHMESPLSAFGGLVGEGASTVAGWGQDIWNAGADFVTGTIPNLASNASDWLSGAMGGQVVGAVEGAFVGINTSNVGDFKAALDAYVNGAADIINGLNVDASLAQSIKGTAIEESFHEFLLAIKTLLINYVKSLNNLKTEIDTAVDNYVSADTHIGGDVSSDAGEVSSSANNIKID